MQQKHQSTNTYKKIQFDHKLVTASHCHPFKLTYVKKN